MDRQPTAAVNSDDLVPQFPGTTRKLRLMCSYGGHIFPTPHEKSLRYLGGETRMVVVDRCSSLASIVSRLSTSLLHGRRNFSLKYQLPNEELDSLVSLSSDEDLKNLIEEYDRIVATTTTPSSLPFRLRIFIFFSKPETSAYMGPFLDDAKWENWFVDALNGVSLLPRGLSDSAAAVDQLLDLDSVNVENNEKQTKNAIDAHERFAGMSESCVVENNEKQTKNDMDAHELFAGMSDSCVVENNSSPSFGSFSSTPSMANLPSIWVRAEESVRVEQQGYYTASKRPESETHGSQILLSDQSDQHPNSESQNQRMHHRQETLLTLSPQSAEHQQNLQQPQQQHIIHPSMSRSYETPVVPGQVSEQSRQLLQHQQQNQFVPVSAQAQQHVYHPAPNQGDQQLQEQQTPQSQQKAIQGRTQYMHQAPISQAPVYTTQPPHQQVHHQTIYMLPAAPAQPYHTLPQSNNIPDPSLTRYPAQLNVTMLPAPAIQTPTQSETTSSTVPMSQTPTSIQHPSGQNQPQYVSYSQFVLPAQSMAVLHVYYSDQQHSNVVPQYQTVNSFTHGHCPLPSEAQAASHLPPTEQHR